PHRAPPRRPRCVAAFLPPGSQFTSPPPVAQQWTPQQRAACEPDAIRLCNQYVPDVQRTSVCMSHYRRYVSPACRAVLYGGRRKKLRRRHGGCSPDLGAGHPICAAISLDHVAVGILAHARQSMAVRGFIAKSKLLPGNTSGVTGAGRVDVLGPESETDDAGGNSL